MRILICLLLLPALAWAQAYPDRPIRLIVPYPAGGPTDLMGRMIGERLAAAWGQPVVVENRAGASGNIGTHFVAQAAPDGHTLAITGAAALAVNVALFASLPYDPRRDFTAITKVVDIPTVLVVPDASPAKSVQELLDQARRAPGRLNFASPTSGTINHLLGETLRTRYQLEVVHVPFKGNPQATESLLRGDVQFMFDNLSSALPHLRAGKLRALALTGPKRVPALPDVPTMTELGFPGFEGTAWFAVVGPRGLPAGVAAKLNGEIVRILREPQFAERVERFGMQVAPSSEREMAALIEADIVRWGELVRASGARAD
jgi:tripartite-type tricarboxylate transporter receptor subunit TctC